MILTLSAAAVTGYRARLTLTVSSPTAGSTIALYRDDLSGVLVPVLGAAALPPASTVVDDVPALNRPTWWRAIASTGETAITGSPLTISSTLPVLADPRGDAVTQLTVASFDEVAIAGTSSPILVDVESPGDDAVVWLVGPDGARTGTVTLRADSASQLAAARSVLASGRPALLRGSQPGLEDPWFVITDRRERRVTRNVADWRRYLVLNVGILSAAPDPTTPVLGDTLGDLNAAVSPQTLGTISTTWSTLGAIAAADLRAL